MKKTRIILLLIFTAVLGFFYFANTTYFFNRYIATNIKEYGFTYNRVQGTLFSGFNIDKLKYKNKLLSSKVELKFNPIKLLIKKVSVSKVRLINVDKNIVI